MKGWDLYGWNMISFRHWHCNIVVYLLSQMSFNVGGTAICICIFCRSACQQIGWNLNWLGVNIICHLFERFWFSPMECRFQPQMQDLCSSTKLSFCLFNVLSRCETQLSILVVAFKFVAMPYFQWHLLLLFSNNVCQYVEMLCLVLARVY